MPPWLEKWTALILEFVEEEQRLLPAQLLALPRNLAAYTPASAAAEAKGALPRLLLCSQRQFPRVSKCADEVAGRPLGFPAAGVSDNRVQNVVITLDKVKLCIQKSGNTAKPPLRMLSDSEATEYLWTGAPPPSSWLCVWGLSTGATMMNFTGASPHSPAGH